MMENNEEFDNIGDNFETNDTGIEFLDINYITSTYDFTYEYEFVYE